MAAKDKQTTERCNYMRKSTLARWVTTLAVCALFLPMGVSAKDQVERPFIIRGEVAMIVNINDGSATFVDMAVATHEGRVINCGEAQLDAEGATVWATGTATAANGDQVSWKIDGAAPDTVVFLNGTGRFADVSGGFVMESSTKIITPGPDPDTVTVTRTYTGVGTTTY
jgi:hypothetical protein